MTEKTIKEETRRIVEDYLRGERAQVGFATGIGPGLRSW